MTILYIIVWLVSAQVSSDPIVVKQGKIEFERKLNTHFLLDPNNPNIEEYKKHQEQFSTSSFQLHFNEKESLYQFISSDQPNTTIFNSLTAETNSVYTNFEANRRVSRKVILGKTFFVNDSIQPIVWKLTDERRTIAGFECRRADAMILDSVYVVAFFTEQILAKGGPESFTGLPGMILGVALSLQHITWFATKVYSVQPQTQLTLQDTNAERVSVSALRQLIKDVFKTRTYLERTLKNAALW